MSSRSREEIAREALALVDAEGLDALSMRRLAARLDMGVMSLYHYVNSKQDLMRLVAEAVLHEMLVPEDEFASDDWRLAVTQIARRTHALFVRHPWVLEAGMDEDDDPDGDPETFQAHFEQTQAAFAPLGLDPETRLKALLVVDDYVFGHVLRTQTGWADEEQAPDRFEDGLAWLLDGIEAAARRA